MSKKFLRGALALLLSLGILVSLLAGLSLSAGAANNYAYNSGVRGTVCISLSSAALSYWTGDYSFATLNAQSGDTLRSTLRTKITSNRSTVGYDGLKTYLPYTDAYQGSSSQITLFYANRPASSSWDGSTWNREHMWPDSLGGNAVEGDLHSMRPTDQKANSTRGNSKYANVRELYPEAYKTAVTNSVNGAVTAGYYYSNTYFEPLDASKGDAARVLLYDYVVATSMESPTVAIKDIDTLLQWHTADPVDTYEMQRNDIVQSIEGCRNPFVDYPELAWRIFSSYTMPSGMVTPSSGSAYTVSASTNNSSYGTVSASGYVITATPATGYYASGYTILSGTASVTQNGNTFTVTPSSNCSIRINFAKKTSVTVTLSADGTTSTVSGYAGEAINLSTPTAPSGYTFVGWVTATVAETSTRPATIYTTTYTPSASCTLYALYSHTTGSGSGNGDYVKVTSAPSSWTGDYLIVYESGNLIFNGSLTTLDANNNNQSVTISSNTIPAAQGDAYKVTIAGASGSYTIQTASGYYIGNTSDSNTLSSSTTTAYTNSITYNSGDVDIVSSGGSYLRFNSASNTMRFRYYKSSSYTGQKAIQLYKKDGSAGTTTYMTSTGAACQHTNTMSVAAVAATCTQGGYTAGVYCNDCGTYISGHTATAALGHNYTTYVSANFSGHTYRCSRCSETSTEAHTFTSSTSGTTTTYTCSVCAYSYQTEASTYTVTYNDRGSTTTASVVQGGSVTLPTTASTVSGYTFAGWVTAAIPTETSAAPTVQTGSYTPTGNVTLYALYTRTEAGQGSAYSLVTDAAQLTSGADVVIAAADYDYAISTTQNTANRGSAAITKSGNTITLGSNVCEFTLGAGTTSGTWSFYDAGNSGYLYAASSSANQLKTQSTLDANGSWEIEVTSAGVATVTAQGSYTRNWMKYNQSTNPTIFSCYQSTNTTQKPLALYVKGAGSAAYYTTAPTSTCAHTYGAWSSNNNGTHSKTCSKCGDVVTTDCTYTSSISGATTTFTCTVCSYSYQTTANSYTVTFNDRGSTTTASCVEGGTVTLPATASTVEGYTFSGWVAAAIATETTAAPTVLTGSYQPTGSVTLYALYTRTAAGQGGASAYTRVTSLSSITSGASFVITSKSTGKAWSQTVSNNYVTPGGTYTGDAIASPAETDIWTISDGTLTYNDGLMSVDGAVIGCDGGNLYSSAAKKISLSSSNSTGWTIVASDDGFLIQSGSNILCYNSSGGWRPYAGGYGQDRVVYIYKLGSGTLIYYTTNPTSTSSTLQINSAAPVLNGKIDMTYTVTVPSGYSNPYMVFTFNGVNTTVSDYTTESGSLKFKFTGINPQCMGDDITATLYATKNGATQTVSAANYSVKAYCVNKLADNTISSSLRKLLSDLLKYGAAAQTYMNYKTNALVTTGVTGTSYSTFTNLSGNAASFDGAADANTCWTSAGLTLTDSVAMTFRFYANSVSGLTVYVTLGERTQTFTSFTSVGGGIYEISFAGISAEQFGDTVTAVFERDSEQIGNELSYSVNAYVQSKQADSNAALQALVKALYNYGASAAAYAG
ncbi:MAG: endonuclease [Oscillospiraceae bacterium]|nr:endonuclease [Oscillospiraceae bacterium]